MTTLPPECIEDMQRRNRMISKANARIEQLRATNANFSAREMAQGIEIKHLRPSFKGRDFVAVSYEIIPY